MYLYYASVIFVWFMIGIAQLCFMFMVLCWEHFYPSRPSADNKNPWIHSHAFWFLQKIKKKNFKLYFYNSNYWVSELSIKSKKQPAKSISELVLVYPEVKNKSTFLLLTAKICSAFIPTDILTVHLEKMTLNWKCQPSSTWALFLSSL